MTMRTPHSLPVYHKKISAGAESWTRHHVKRAMWENRKAINVIKSGMIDADSVSVYIPLAALPPLLSIQPGDVLVKGLVVDELSNSFTLTALKKKYPQVVVVRSVDTYDQGSGHLHHLQIGAS